jgi:hypothetical protein
MVVGIKLTVKCRGSLKCLWVVPERVHHPDIAGESNIKVKGLIKCNDSVCKSVFHLFKNFVKKSKGRKVEKSKKRGLF